MYQYQLARMIFSRPLFSLSWIQLAYKNLVHSNELIQAIYFSVVLYGSHELWSKMKFGSKDDLCIYIEMPGAK